MSSRPIPTGPSPEARALLRALALLMWGLPLVLLMAVPGAVSQWFHMFFLLVVQDLVTRGFWLLDMLPTLGSVALLGYGILQLGRVKGDDDAWLDSLFHARLITILLMGMAPFLMWRDWIPHEEVFQFGAQVFAFVACVFIIHLNFVLSHLSRFLANPVLEADTRMFSKLNLVLLTFVLAATVVFLVASHLQWYLSSPLLTNLMDAISHQGSLLLMLLILPSVATTMSMIWKTRQTVMGMVFEPEVFPEPPPPPALDDLGEVEEDDLDKEELEEKESVSSPGDTSCPADAARSPDRE